MQAQLKEIGINIKLDILESGAYAVRHVRGDYSFKLWGGGFKADIWATYGPSFMCGVDLRKRGENTARYCDKEMDVLLGKAQVELDPKKRRELLRQVLVKLAEECLSSA